MATTYVTFDTRSGDILSLHHGATDREHALEGAQHHAGSGEHVGVITVPSDAVEPGKLYKVDVDRKALVAAAAHESGVGFGFSGMASSGQVAK